MKNRPTQQGTLDEWNNSPSSVRNDTVDDAMKSPWTVWDFTKCIEKNLYNAVKLMTEEEQTSGSKSNDDDEDVDDKVVAQGQVQSATSSLNATLPPKAVAHPNSSVVVASSTTTTTSTTQHGFSQLNMSKNHVDEDFQLARRLQQEEDHKTGQVQQQSKNVRWEDQALVRHTKKDQNADMQVSAPATSGWGWSSSQTSQFPPPSLPNRGQVVRHGQNTYTVPRVQHWRIMSIMVQLRSTKHTM